CENAGKNDTWHLYSSLAAAAYLRALLGACHPFPFGSSEPPDRGRLPQVWNVPVRVAPFVGRDQPLSALREQLRRSRIAVVQGMGGAGKTTLVNEYAHRFAARYQLVWWVDAQEAHRIVAQLADLGVVAGWVAADADIRVAMEVVKRNLRGLCRWL